MASRFKTRNPSVPRPGCLSHFLSLKVTCWKAASSKDTSFPSGSLLGTAYRTQDTTVSGHRFPPPPTMSGFPILPLSPRVHLPTLSPLHFSLPSLGMVPEEIRVTRQLYSGLKQCLSSVGAHTIRLWQHPSM